MRAEADMTYEQDDILGVTQKAPECCPKYIIRQELVKLLTKGGSR